MVEKRYICEICGEEQGLVGGYGETEFYEHEGRCPACGEYVLCVRACIKMDEE